MDEAALLQRTRDLVHKANLPTTIGLGENWIIVLAASEILPPSAAERYEAALADLKEHFPGDVLDFSHTHRSGLARYLLLRAGSTAVNYWQGRSA